MPTTICTLVSSAPWTVGTLTPVPALAVTWTWTWDSGPGGTYHDVVSYDSGFNALSPHQLTQTLVDPTSFGVTSGHLGFLTGAAWLADVWASGAPGTYCGSYRFYDSGGTEIAGGASPAFCAYGTQPISSTTSGIIITTGLIDLMLTALGIGAWASILFDTFVGKILYGGDLCSSPPPAMPTFTSVDFVTGSPGVPNPASLAKWWQGLQAVAWPYFCQCNPAPFGSPSPIPYPLPTATAPAGAPSGPTIITCEDQDLCTVLNDLARQMAALQTQVAIVNQTTQLIQRQHVPFAYVPGTLHSGLTGAGQFAVQGILGLAVQLTTLPPGIGSTSDDPVEYFGAGWISTGTPDGWRRTSPIAHNPFWLDVQPEDTLVGYTFEPGVVANIEEFLREP